jgi:peroxiredoxin
LAPDFTLQATDGTTVRLSDLQGQLVLLNFWASWCAPCKHELPMLEAAQDDRLAILGIAVREPLVTVTDFAANLGLTLTLLPDQNGKVSEAYTVRGLPTTLFVDHKGVIVARHVGPLDPASLESYLNTLLTASSINTTTP